MIIMKLQGGLGNQLFQWAYAYSLASLYNTKFYLDKNSYYFDKLRTYELNKFPNIKTGLNDFDLRYYRKPYIQQEVDDFNFKYRIIPSETNLVLNGYWQTEKYFSDYRPAIVSMLSPEPEKQKELAKIIKPNSVSVHVRRTDYLNLQEYHTVQPMNYFEQALKSVDYKYIYVFSDDIPWCKENFKYDNIEFISGYDNVDDLWMMSMCSNNIISNSSFSWWGAWLNENKNKTVIAPSNWFGPKNNLNTDDIIPEGWVKI